jgi:predicted lipoprotein with Yx(FWY)xxD motif
MRTKAGAPALLALAAVVLTGCGGAYGGSSSGSGSSASGSGSSSSSGMLRTADSELGTIVVDADGRTVYVSDDDDPGSGKSACTGDCAAQWPPVEAGAGAPSGDGVDAELGTITRDDGTMQVTLGGSPLYLFAGDGGPGDVTGEAVGHVFWVVGPDGKKITEAPAPGADFSY